MNDNEPLQAARNWGVMLRRPTWTFARVTIAAATIDEAMAKIKALVESCDPSLDGLEWDAEEASREPVDYITVENEDYDNVELMEWEKPR